MSPENRRAAASAEMLRAAEALREARALADLGLFNGAASRAYYAAYHAGSAMLIALGKQPRTHRGVSRLLSKHLGEKGLLGDESIAAFGRLQQRRSVADYRASEAIAEDEARTLVQDAAAFHARAAALVDRLAMTDE